MCQDMWHVTGDDSYVRPAFWMVVWMSPKPRAAPSRPPLDIDRVSRNRGSISSRLKWGFGDPSLACMKTVPARRQYGTAHTAGTASVQRARRPVAGS